VAKDCDFPCYAQNLIYCKIPTRCSKRRKELRFWAHDTHSYVDLGGYRILLRFVGNYTGTSTGQTLDPSAQKRQGQQLLTKYHIFIRTTHTHTHTQAYIASLT